MCRFEEACCLREVDDQSVWSHVPENFNLHEHRLEKFEPISFVTVGISVAVI